MSYLQKYDGSNFIDVPSILEELKTNNLILITSRNCGKSYSSYLFVLNNGIKSGKEFVIVRLTLEELKQSDIISTFQYLIDYLKLENMIVKIDGIYYVKTKIAAFVYFSGAHNTKSQGSLNNVEYIVFDEFLNDNYKISKGIVKGADVYKSFQRNNIVKCIFLGNKNKLMESDLLAEYGIEFDFNKKDTQIIRNDVNDIVGVCISYTLKNQAQSQFQKTFLNTPVQSFTEGQTVQSCLTKSIYSGNFNKVYERYNALFVIKFRDSFLLFGFGKKEEKEILYIKELYTLDGINVPMYFILASDFEPNFIDIKSSNLKDDFSIVFDGAKKGCYYSSCYTKELFKILINVLAVYNTRYNCFR